MVNVRKSIYIALLAFVSFFCFLSFSLLLFSFLFSRLADSFGNSGAGIFYIGYNLLSVVIGFAGAIFTVARFSNSQAKNLDG
jgi:hypothetical protein